MTIVQVRKGGKLTRGDTLQARQTQAVQQSMQGHLDVDLISRTFGTPRVVEQTKLRVIHDTRSIRTFSRGAHGKRY